MGRITKDGTKECPVCLEVKLLEDFPRSRQPLSGIYPYCKSCATDRARKAWRAKCGDPKTVEEKRNAPCKHCKRQLPYEAYFKNEKRLSGRAPVCIECVRAKRFNTGWEAIEKIRSKQEGRCGCCKKKLPFDKEYIDHCHSTGKVRGILCRNCNTAIGFAKEDIKSLENMILYLIEHGKSRGE